MAPRLFTRIIIRILLLSLFSLIHSSWLLGQSQVTIASEKFNEVRSKIMEEVQSGKIPSMSVAVAKDEKVIWEESFGWADREKMIKATPHTMYSMASISKPIATTGLMVLVERGLVDLNEPVNTYIAPAKLKAFEGNSSDVKVTHILNHTSGLPTHYTCFYLDQPNRQPPAYPESIRRYGILVHPPGEFYQYANFGFGLTSHIIEKISNRSFADFMRMEVFLPLGMTHASIDVEKGLEQFAAERYDTKGNPVLFYISDHTGASQVFCSAHDLIRFGMFHLKNRDPKQKKILKDETLDLLRKDSDPNPDNNRYGLGWFLRENEYGYPIAWHTGSMDGVNNILKMVPSENIAVVVLINTSSPLRNTIPKDIISVLLPKYAEGWKKEQDRPRQRPKPFEPVEELLGEWNGEIHTYENILPVTITFQKDGDIHVKMRSQYKTLLNNVRFSNNVLTGSCYGTIPSGDAQQFPHRISLKILLKNNVLSGYITTSFDADRDYGNFSSYICLEKKTSK